MLEQIADEYKGKVTVVGMNTDNTGDTAAGLGIMSIPAILFFKDGQEVSRLIGAVPKAKVAAEVAKIV